VSTAAVGCATTNTKHHGLGAGQWEARLPTTASPIHELAYGKGGSSEPADLSLDGLDDPNTVLAPATPAPLARLAKAAPHKAQHRVLPKQTLALATQPTAAATPEPVAAPAPQPMAAQPIVLAQNDTTSRYAAREQQAQKQQEFRGGDAIVITAGTLVVILLIVILILLLVR
jgi:hypothetical protein